MQARKKEILYNAAPILPLLEGNRRKRLNTAGNIYTLKDCEVDRTRERDNVVDKVVEKAGGVRLSHFSRIY